MTILNTARLWLEPFADEHLDGLSAMNSDAEVMRYVSGKPETREETAASIEFVKRRWVERGYSWWSFIEKETGQLIGAGCIQHLGGDKANPHEIGWRLRRDKWGLGLASEAARTMAAFAFDELKAPQLTAICDPGNADSVKVMQRLGMVYRGIERWHGSDCAVYGMTRSDWQARP